MNEASSPPAKDTPESLLRERGAALRAEGQRVSDRVWAAICGEGADPLTALKAIRDYVKPISPGTQWGDTVVWIAEAAIAKEEAS